MPSTSEQLTIRNKALKALEPLDGDWRIEISNAEFLDDGAMLGEQMSATWLDGRALLILRSRIANGPPASVQVVGRNEDADDFKLFYADDRGVSGVYRMAFSDGHWTLSRADPGFHQRFAGRLRTTVIGSRRPGPRLMTRATPGSTTSTRPTSEPDFPASSTRATTRD